MMLDEWTKRRNMMPLFFAYTQFLNVDYHQQNFGIWHDDNVQTLSSKLDALEN